ncbi:hypothetical protein KAZ82_00545, partial [Candidatus Babeliales bacterium]|nr:hypothetical protein [Candidatus Babeliales bacterium]
FDTEHLTRAVKVARQLNLTAEQSPKTKHIKQTTHSKSFDPTMATTIRAYDFRNKSRNADQIPAAKEKTKKSTITFIDSDTIENHFHHTKNISQK